MGREIEVKIPLMQKEFMKIMAWILESEKNPGIVFKNQEIVFKTDEYYSQYKSMKSRLNANKNDGFARFNRKRKF